MKYPIAALILAGGGSTRMGQDKALLAAGEQNLLQEKARWLIEHCEAVYISARNQEDYAQAGVPVIPDKQPDCGPLMGLYSGLEEIDSSHCFLIACDIAPPPWELLEILYNARDTHDAVIPRTTRGLEPLFGLYARKALTQLQVQLDAGARSLHRFLDQIDTHYVDTDAALFKNLNTPEDYAADIQSLENTPS